MSILGTAFVLNVYIVRGNALWWQWGFGLLLSMAGGLLVAVAISSLLRRPAMRIEPLTCASASAWRTLSSSRQQAVIRACFAARSE
jgi:hypothetical protein